MIFSSVNIESVLSDLNLKYTNNVDVSSCMIAGVSPKTKKYEVRSNHLILMVGHPRTTCHTIHELDEKYKMESATALALNHNLGGKRWN
jgi:hypothetical protein